MKYMRCMLPICPSILKSYVVATRNNQEQQWKTKFLACQILLGLISNYYSWAGNQNCRREKNNQNTSSNPQDLTVCFWIDMPGYCKLGLGLDPARQNLYSLYQYNVCFIRPIEWWVCLIWGKEREKEREVNQTIDHIVDNIYVYQLDDQSRLVVVLLRAWFTMSHRAELQTRTLRLALTSKCERFACFFLCVCVCGRILIWFFPGKWGEKKLL